MSFGVFENNYMLVLLIVGFFSRNEKDALNNVVDFNFLKGYIILTSMSSIMFIRCIWLNDKSYEDFEIYQFCKHGCRGNDLEMNKFFSHFIDFLYSLCLKFIALCRIVVLVR
jgi:hypothetical protein